MSSPDINGHIEENYLSYTDEELGGKLGISAKAVRGRRRRMGLVKSDVVTLRSDAKPGSKPGEDSNETILMNLLEENGVSLEEVATIRLSSYQQGHKTPEGGSEVVNLGGAAVTLKVDSKLTEGPAWPVIQQAAPVNIEHKSAKRTARSLKRAFIYSDIQVGFRRNLITGELHSFHDDEAIKVAMAIQEDVQPDVVVIIGDYIDFPMFGRFDQEPGFQVTTQATIDRSHEILAQIRAITPDAEIVWISGNHDIRLQNYVIKNAMAAFGLQRANAPEEWPVMSLEFLLRLDELDIKYIDGYPNGEYYINERLKCEHGRKVAPRGKIAVKLVDDETVSVITGHNHRVEMIHRTTKTKDGPRVTMGMTLGCLCKIDGSIPSTKSAIDARGNTVKSQEDWQHAVGIVEYQDGDMPFQATPILIHNGTAIYNDILYEA